MALIAVVGLGALGACAGTDGSGDDAGAAPTIGRSLTVATPAALAAPTTSTAPEAPPPPRAIGVTSAATPTGDDPADDSTDESTRPLTDLDVGDCVDLPGLADPAVAEAVSAPVRVCDEPHDAEIYARVSLSDDPEAPYPGDDQVVVLADAACLERFEPYIGLRYVDARLEIVHLRPPRAAWVRGDRVVVCAVINSVPGPLVGTVARADG